jgi:hypothetical protein
MVGVTDFLYVVLYIYGFHSFANMFIQYLFFLCPSNKKIVVLPRKKNMYVPSKFKESCFRNHFINC